MKLEHFSLEGRGFEEGDGGDRPEKEETNATGVMYSESEDEEGERNLPPLEFGNGPAGCAQTHFVGGSSLWWIFALFKKVGVVYSGRVPREI